MGESGTHVPNHNHQQPPKEPPCPPEASSHRAASLPSAVTLQLSLRSHQCSLGTWGQKAMPSTWLLVHLLTSLRFQHLPSGPQCPHCSRLTLERFLLAYLTPLLHSGFTATLSSTLLPLMSQSSHKHWMANVKKRKKLSHFSWFSVSVGLQEAPLCSLTP